VFDSRFLDGDKFDIDTTPWVQHRNYLSLWFAFFDVGDGGKLKYDVFAPLQDRYTRHLVSTWAAEVVKSWSWKGDPGNPETYMKLDRRRWKRVMEAIAIDLERRLDEANRAAKRTKTRE